MQFEQSARQVYTNTNECRLDTHTQKEVCVLMCRCIIVNSLEAAEHGIMSIESDHSTKKRAITILYLKETYSKKR